MGGGIPHSSIIREHQKDYLDDVAAEIATISTSLTVSSEYTALFKACTAAYTVLARLSRSSPTTLVQTAASIVRRCPLLITAGQLPLARIDLRRFVECVSRYPYFAEHPIEWQRLLKEPATGVVRDDADPIAYCANREQRWYTNYILSRFEDRSGLIKNSVDSLTALYREMSRHVHTSVDAATSLKLVDALHAPTNAELAAISRELRRGYIAAVILAIAVRPDTMNQLNAIEQAWFDWLIGAASSKAIRGGNFLAA